MTTLSCGCTDSFQERMKRTIQRKTSRCFLLLSPEQSEMPVPMHWHDDPFFPFSKRIIAATQDIVLGYVYDFAAYMAHGAAGAVALERAIGYAGQDVIKVLHGPFAGEQFVPMIYENAFGADAATLTHAQDYAIYKQNPAHGAFVITSDVEVGAVPTYDASGGRFHYPNLGVFPILGKSVLYASYQDDFAEQCRKAILDAPCS